MIIIDSERNPHAYDVYVRYGEMLERTDTPDDMSFTIDKHDANISVEVPLAKSGFMPVWELRTLVMEIENVQSKIERMKNLDKQQKLGFSEAHRACVAALKKIIDKYGMDDDGQID